MTSGNDFSDRAEFQAPQGGREIVRRSAPPLPAKRESWAQVSAVVRISPADEDTWSMVELTRAHAIIGRKPGCDITIAHPDLESVHTYLHFDAGGCHAVDLRTQSGMRINNRAVTHGRFFPGDTLEVGGFRVRLDGIIINGCPLRPEDYGESPMGGEQAESLVGVQLRSLTRQAHYWSINSSVAFIGSEATCAVTLPEEHSVSRIHGALVRTEHDIFYVDLASRGSQINGHHVFNCCKPLFHDDILTVGRVGLLVHRSDARADCPQIESDSSRQSSRNETRTAARAGHPDTDTILAALISRIQEQHDSALERQNEAQVAMAQLLRQMQNEQGRVFETHLNRIRQMDREIAELKARLANDPALGNQQLAPPATGNMAKIRPNPAKAPPRNAAREKAGVAAPRPSDEKTTTQRPPESIRTDAKSTDAEASPEFTTAWLIDRVSQLEREQNSTWRDLFGRLRGK